MAVGASAKRRATSAMVSTVTSHLSARSVRSASAARARMCSMPVTSAQSLRCSQLFSKMIFNRPSKKAQSAPGRIAMWVSAFSEVGVRKGSTTMRSAPAIWAARTLRQPLGTLSIQCMALTAGFMPTIRKHRQSSTSGTSVSSGLP